MSIYEFLDGRTITYRDYYNNIQHATIHSLGKEFKIIWANDVRSLSNTTNLISSHLTRNNEFFSNQKLLLLLKSKFPEEFV